MIIERCKKNSRFKRIYFCKLCNIPKAIKNDTDYFFRITYMNERHDFIVFNLCKKHFEVVKNTFQNITIISETRFNMLKFMKETKRDDKKK